MKIKSTIAVSASGLIFNPDTGESFSVNPMGAEIIASLLEGKPQEMIKKSVLERYNTDKDTVEKDFEDFISLLRNYSLIYND